MIDIAVQKKGKILFPFSQEDFEALSDYHDNQLLRARITGMGARKERSYAQLQTFWCACRTVASNTDDPNWNTKKKVAFQVKVATRFVDDSAIAVRPDGTVQFQYRSISFENLKHMEACQFFDRAFEVMANFLGCTVPELLKEAE